MLIYTIYFTVNAKKIEPVQGFIVDSYRFYQIAKDGYSKANQGFEDSTQNDALVAIVFSALALEAFINEILSLAKCEKQTGETEAFLDKLIDAIDESASNRKQTQEKFMLASNALDSGFNKGEKPYQDFADLFRLRDCLVHLKPEDVIEEGENGEIKYFGRKLTERLCSKGIFLKDTSVESIILKISTAKAALWACNTASEMVNAILDKLPASFRDNNLQIDLYRNRFQPPE
ncbi:MULTISPECIES: hypothetical protein [unclassified Nodularia (in: cyanobacteria)]|uniref:hypothetical protein n=1 Tax=unclassified Nodularia (in: cyanobacteria) TaxID=2656917 RepID=UPI0018813E7C|nr:MULTISPECIES: hypothetical protein [unclassified Nodularia (in: cyanobacteria)]MBE9199670.1 hypothetical protein [Nodularia sp. LEGE 06071]MCC2692221.1 hypothetical protein [Nodularia sp. LEGE 04288]